MRSNQTYAERRYREDVKTWRRAIRRPLLLLVGPIFVGSLIWGISEHNKSAYLAGFVTGLSGAFAVMFREYCVMLIGADAASPLSDRRLRIGQRLLAITLKRAAIGFEPTLSPDLPAGCSGGGS